MDHQFNGTIPNKYGRIVVDGAQDISPIELRLLSLGSVNNRFTVLGDTAQRLGLHRGIRSWRELNRASSFVITSNRAVDEWLGLFEDPILGNSALDWLANASYQITIEGQSYRERLSPHRALLGAGREGGD